MTFLWIIPDVPTLCVVGSGRWRRVVEERGMAEHESDSRTARSKRDDN